MSANFIKCIPKWQMQRYFVQISQLAGKKIPCGVFGGFNNTGVLENVIDYLNKIGINLSRICTIDDAYIYFSQGGQKFSSNCNDRKFTAF